VEFPDLVRLCATYMRGRVAVPRMFVVLRVPVIPPPPPPVHAIFDAPTERYPMGMPVA
jgi:hypothetical protein